MSKKTTVHPVGETLLNAKKKWALKPWKEMEGTSIHTTNWKNPIWEDYHLESSNSMTFWRKQDSKKITGCQGKGEMSRGAQGGILKAVEATLFDTMMRGACHCAFVQAHRTYDIESEP